MQSLVRNRSIVINGHKTSISLGDAFFGALKEISKQRHLTLAELITGVGGARTAGNLSLALRLFVLDFYRSEPKSEARHRTKPESQRLAREAGHGEHRVPTPAIHATPISFANGGCGEQRVHDTCCGAGRRRTTNKKEPRSDAPGLPHNFPGRAISSLRLPDRRS